MRIISGSHKGHIINPPRGLPIRPITDRSKTSLFNIIANRVDLEECEVLDLFSGGGSISLEFASRGAQRVVAVDRFPGCVEFLKREAKKLNLDMIEAIKADVMRYIVNTEYAFDIIFADPPYAFSFNEYEKLIKGIFENKLLKEDGFFILEHHSITKLNHIPHLFEQRAYGQNVMSFFKSQQ